MLQYLLSHVIVNEFTCPTHKALQQLSIESGCLLQKEKKYVLDVGITSNTYFEKFVLDISVKVMLWVKKQKPS